jgi:curved DNA-binding protein CbpA
MDKRNPYEVLGISRDADIISLKKKFKKLALIMHPDRGGSDALFDLLKDCYLKISKDIKTREMDKQFNELKLECGEYMSEKGTSKIHDPPTKIDPLNFSQSFNLFFEDNRSKTVHDIGYGKIMEASREEREDITIKKQIKKFKLEKFNETFDEQEVLSNVLVKKYEPDAFALVNKQLNYQELGEDNIADFSGTNKTNKELNFMDYKIAHSTSKLIDTSIALERKAVSSVKELEENRKIIDTKMTKKELQMYNKHLRTIHKKENKRMELLNRDDIAAFKKFERTNAFLIPNEGG